MTTDFKERIARIEARNGARNASGPTETPQDRLPRPSSGSRGGSTGLGMGKMIAIGAGLLLGLPLVVGVGTFLLATNADRMGLPGIKSGPVEASDVTALTVVTNKDIFGMKADPATQAARDKVKAIVAARKNGTLTAEELAYWASPEGKQEYRALLWKAAANEKAVPGPDQ